MNVVQIIKMMKVNWGLFLPQEEVLVGRTLVQNITAQDTLVSGGPLPPATTMRGRERDTGTEKEIERETEEERDMKDMSSRTTINALPSKHSILSLLHPMVISRSQGVHRQLTTEALNMRGM